MPLVSTEEMSERVHARTLRWNDGAKISIRGRLDLDGPDFNPPGILLGCASAVREWGNLERQSGTFGAAEGKFPHDHWRFGVDPGRGSSVPTTHKDIAL